MADNQGIFSCTLNPNVVIMDNVKPLEMNHNEIVFRTDDLSQSRKTASLVQEAQALENELQQRHDLLAQKEDFSGGLKHDINYQARLDAIKADLRSGNTDNLKHQIVLADQNIAADTRFDELGNLKPTSVALVPVSTQAGHKQVT